MQINHWVLLFVLTVSFSQWAFSESQGFPIEGSGCQAVVHQKGIPVGNNNYQGKDCNFKRPIETQKVILIQESRSAVTNDGAHRQIASEKEDLIEFEAEEKTTQKEIEYNNDSSKYDYGTEE